MQIKFLGTSSGWPLPRLGHHCEICDSQDPRDKRTRSQVLVNQAILLDAGPDTYTHLIKEAQPEKIFAVFITHAHPDHTFGLWDIDHLYNKKGKITLYSLEETFKIISQQGVALEKAIKSVAEPLKTLKLNRLQAILFPVKHAQKIPTVGVKLTEKDKSFAYIPDFAALPKESANLAKQLDVLVIDGSSLKKAGPKGWGHETISEGIALAKRLKAKSVYFTHIGHGNISAPHEKLEKYVQEHGGPNFHIAYDGLEVNL
jgi:phosphoribosyl 1,2-cyclic phosphate phosphodiesterase